MRVAKWVHSLALRLPKGLVDDMGLSAGDEVNVVAVGKPDSIGREGPTPRAGARAPRRPECHAPLAL